MVFANVCFAGDVATVNCILDSVVVPVKGSITLSFAVIVDDPVTTSSIENSVSSPSVDHCAANDRGNDYLESTPTAGIGTSTGFEAVAQSDWNETRVRGRAVIV